MEPIVIVDHDPGWSAAFEALRDVLEEALSRVDASIEHVGSRGKSSFHASRFTYQQITN